MRSRSLTALALAVGALAISTTFSGAAGARGISPSSSAEVSSPVVLAPAAATCFSNLKDMAEWATSSQNFEAAQDAYDSEGADDFKLKKACKVRSMQVPGNYFSGTGPADSVNVRFYKDDGGKPKATPFVERLDLPIATDDAGSLEFNVTPTVNLAKKTTYWVSVQVNMDYDPNGQWGWLVTTNQIQKPAVWRNQGDGFGYPGCDKWANMQGCIEGALGPDFMFSLGKKAI